MRKTSLFRPLFAACTLALLATSHAGAATSDELIKKGTVKIGVLTGVPPYGSTNEKGELVGYDIDVARLLGTYMGVKVELVPLPPPARIPSLQGGKVDFLVATLGATPEREKQVMFTEAYSGFRLIVVANKSTSFAKIEDLAGKKVGVNRGGSQDAFLTKANVAGLQVGRFQDDATVFDAVATSQVDAGVIPEATAKDAIQKKPEANMAVKFTLFSQGNSMAVKLEETELRDWLNKAIAKMKASGELDKISVKWTGSAVPK